MVGGGVLATLSGGVAAISKESISRKIFSGTYCKPFRYQTCTGVDAPHNSTTPFIGESTIQRDDCWSRFGVALNESIINQCTILPEREGLPSFFVQGSSYAHHFSLRLRIFVETMVLAFQCLLITHVIWILC